MKRILQILGASDDDPDEAITIAGRAREVAEYCVRDVRATVDLYRIWKERLAGIK